MTWLRACIELWLDDYCFKHRRKRVGFYKTHCPDCERERRVKNPLVDYTDLAKKRLGWK